jgi:hemerythrin-like metal-binding protein
MTSLEWTASHVVWLGEIDDEHREIIELAGELQAVLPDPDSSPAVRRATQRLYTSIKEHFAHEERLMRAARYGSLRWHRNQHNFARKRVRQFIVEVNAGDRDAGIELIDYLKSWLNDHTRIADRMMAAFLRNDRRTVCKMTFRVGTRSAMACSWVDRHGDKFDPLRPPGGL